MNREGTKNIAEQCKKNNTTMIQISTDYVFDGEKGAPYTEEDLTNPINVYGASKLDSLNQIDINRMATHIETTLESFNSIMHKFDNGEGSIGKLINDENLYKNLEAASKELEELLRDLKENPKRYVHLSVFGKKTTEYESLDSNNN